MRKLVILGILICIFLMGCGDKTNLEETTKIDLSGTKEYIILHTNDIHDFVDEEGDSIGYQNIVAAVNYYKENYDNVLVFDAGDMNNTNSAMDSSETRDMVLAANAIGYDAWTLGNNDNIELTKEMDFPMVSSNLNIEGYSNCKSNLIIEKDGLKIGIFGLSAYSSFAPETMDKKEAAKAAVKELKSQGAEFIICLGHLGVTKGDESSYSLAQNVPGIDLIIDGHSHTLLKNGKIVGDTLVVQAGEHLEYLGVVKLYVKDNKVISMEASVLSKADISLLLEGR